jgi:hypothetical protein
LDKAPAKGAFLWGIAMLETADFFEKQINECNAQAAQAASKADREFWRCLADRWAHVLQADKIYDGPNLETVRSLRPMRSLRPSRPSKRRAA